ncbi:hypothetical protein [Parendozoicomonas haliclonae]|nr:hypothetical protein [Parendozoicomonas haliclonae]
MPAHTYHGATGPRHVAPYPYSPQQGSLGFQTSPYTGTVPPAGHGDGELPMDTLGSQNLEPEDTLDGSSSYTSTDSPHPSMSSVSSLSERSVIHNPPSPFSSFATAPSPATAGVPGFPPPPPYHMGFGTAPMPGMPMSGMPMSGMPMSGMPMSGMPMHGAYPPPAAPGGSSVPQLTGLDQIQSGSSERIAEQKFHQALLKVGRNILQHQNKTLMVKLCMSNLYGLINSLKGADDQSVFSRDALASLKPSDKKVSTRLKALLNLPQVLKTKFNGDKAAETLVLIFLGQMVICDASSKTNPNQMLVNDISAMLAKEGFDMSLSTPQGMQNRQRVIDCLAKSGLKLNPSASKDIPMLDEAIRKNIAVFNGVEVEDLQGALDRFANELTAPIPNPHQKAAWKSHIVQMLSQANPMLPNPHAVGSLLLNLQGLFNSFPQAPLAYELIKAIVTAPDTGLSDIFAQQGVSLSDDDVQALDTLLAGQEAEGATKQALGQVFTTLDGLERDACLDVAIEEMNFIPSQGMPQSSGRGNTSTHPAAVGRPSVAPLSMGGTGSRGVPLHEALRQNRNDLYRNLAINDTTLRSFTGALYSKGVIEILEKQSVLEDRGLKGANALLDLLELKLEQNPSLEKAVLECMAGCEALSDMLRKVKQSMR